MCTHIINSHSNIILSLSTLIQLQFFLYTENFEIRIPIVTFNRKLNVIKNFVKINPLLKLVSIEWSRNTTKAFNSEMFQVVHLNRKKKYYKTSKIDLTVQLKRNNNKKNVTKPVITLIDYNFLFQPHHGESLNMTFSIYLYNIR